jgi:hypothetical protein
MEETASSVVERQIVNKSHVARSSGSARTEIRWILSATTAVNAKHKVRIGNAMSVQTLADLVNGSSVVQTPSPTRLQSLFTFTSQQRLSNAAGYDANVLWWSIVIKEALREGLVAGRAGDRLTVRIDDGLIDKLRWQGGSESGTVLGKPKGIAGVLVSPG